MSKSKKIIGVDLGSYNSCVSVFEGSEIKIIPNAEGNLTTPSYVAFTKDGIKVGEAAKRQAVINPQNTIFNIKRLMGKTYDQVKHLKRPYKIVDAGGRAAVEIEGKVYKPEEISAMILQKLKTTAEDFLGEEVEKCIITVPAYFNSDERKSTSVAGEIAGFKVERVISEPTAAVLNVDSKSDKTFCVYDFGGQTFDMSVVEVSDDGVYEVKSTDGDLDLGGSVIDEEIVNYLADEFKKETTIDLKKDPMAFQRLFEAAEKAKIELSGCASSEINLPYISSLDGVPKHLVIKLTRAKFDQLAEPIIERTIAKSKSALEKSGKKITEIDTILLVGGSSRIPLAQEKLAKFFGKTPSKELNPDTCVSSGATKQGGVLSGDVKDILLLDVLPISLGILTNGGVMTKMIEGQTTIPCKKENIFSTAADSQTSVEIVVLQGERPMGKDNKKLGTFVLDGIPIASKGVPQISVSFDVDSNGILSVTARDQGTGKENKIRIEGGTSLSKEEIERMKRDAEVNADADKAEKEKIEKMNQADSMIYQTEKQIKEFGDKLSDVNKSDLNSALDELKEAHKSEDLSNIDSSLTKLNEVWNKVSTEMYKNTSTTDPNSTEGTNSEPVTENVDYEEVI